MKNLIKKYKKFMSIVSILLISTLSVTNIYAVDLINNNITQGFVKLLEDAQVLLMSLSTGGAIVMGIFYQFKKKFSDDEMECKQYDKKTRMVIITYIVIMGFSTIGIGILTNYFKIGIPV